MTGPGHRGPAISTASGPGLLLANARVITLEPAQPRAEAVAVRGDAIVAVGSRSETARMAGPDAKVIDCQGMCLVPGFVDAHCHLFATASSLQGLPCGPEQVSNIRELQAAIQRRAAATPQGGWVRGFGYDDLALEEARHPNRWDLDQAAPEHPVRLDHRSGHAAVLNTMALHLAGIHQDTPDPVDGVIQRAADSDELTGLLLEMGAFLRQRLGRLRDAQDTEEGIARLGRLLLSYGITSVHDAGVNNSPDRWDAMAGLQASGLLPCRITMMAGAGQVPDFLGEGRRWGDGDDWLRLGHAKIMLNLTTGTMQPDIAELGRIVDEAHRAGFPAAVHAVEEEAVAAAVQVFKESRSTGGPHSARDRIEHCAECPPELAAQVERSGAMVVTQPGFIFHQGHSYRQRVAPELLGSLYPVSRLHRSGVSVAFGSDAPVIDPNPWLGIYSAVTGLCGDGLTVSGECGAPGRRANGVSVETALKMYTMAGAYAEGSQDLKGSIRPGKLADLALLDRDPTTVDDQGLKGVRPLMTISGGRVVWEAGRD